MSYRKAVDAAIDAFDHEPTTDREKSVIAIKASQFVFARLYEEINGAFWNTYPANGHSFHRRGARITCDDSNQYRSITITQEDRRP